MDNTLIIYMVGDNGASGEGGLEGTISEMAVLNGFQMGLAGLEAKFDEIGGPTTDPHIPVGWAWAVDTPFQWTKQIASHFGGTRNGLIVHWPKGIRARNGMRTQFHHVIDIAPTVLEAAGIPEPKMVNGVKQKPIQGVSMLYSFDNEKIDALSVSSSKSEDGKINITVVNKDPKNQIELSVNLVDIQAKDVDGKIITSSNIGDYNSFDEPEKVTVTEFSDVKISKGKLTAKLPAKSVVLLQVN